MSKGASRLVQRMTEKKVADRPWPMDVVSWIDGFAKYFGERLDALGEHLDRKHGKRR